MAFRIISFYRYVRIERPAALRDELRAHCTKNDILGRILLATEGINGAACGLEPDIANLKAFLLTKFAGLSFRERPHDTPAYHKLVVRARKEICTFGTPVDLAKTGTHIPPEEFKRMLDRHEDFFLLDARNTYETAVGTFIQAHTLPIQTFKEFPAAAKKLHIPKDKPLIMYCTGGIRCEKASAFMRAQGFTDVRQLSGGIINYLNQYPDTHYSGGCFVFDDRLLDQTTTPISSCAHCGTPASLLANCHNLDCDTLYTTCPSCQTHTNTCSATCTIAPRQRNTHDRQRHHYPLVGRVEHYYGKSSVALIRVKKPIEQGWHVLIKGHTTKDVRTALQHIRDHDGKMVQKAPQGSVITVHVPTKVRKNDRVHVLHAPQVIPSATATAHP